MALLDDISSPVHSLNDFIALTIRILNYLPEITSTTIDADNCSEYRIIESINGNTKKLTRPYNCVLMFTNSTEFTEKSQLFLSILSEVASGKESFKIEEYLLVDRIAYTIQQSIGLCFDLLGNPNSARKHVGNRFEELIKFIVTKIGIKNKKVVLKIPYEKTRVYSCETDFVFSPYSEIHSASTHIDNREVVVSLKTSSKDRMGKIFIDKVLMSKFVGRDVKVIGIFLNDIQRKERSKISFTFVAGLFMVYTKFLTKLDGVS